MSAYISILELVRIGRSTSGSRFPCGAVPKGEKPKSRMIRQDAIPLAVLLAVTAVAVVGARQRAQMWEILPSHWRGGEHSAAAAEPHVVIILQPKDCVGMTADLERFSLLLGRFGVKVHGVLAVNRTDSDLANSVLADGMVSFRLEKAPAADLTVVLRALGITATPVVVLADGLGRVRYLAPLDTDPAVVHEEASRIVRIVREMEAPI